MAGTERGKWMVQKIVACFGPDGVDAVKANSCLRRKENNELLKHFFDGSSGEQRVFVFHQPPCNEEGEVQEGAAPELSLGAGTDSRMAGRCCAFIRGVKAGDPIPTDKASTTDLMFTEMHTSALGALSTFLDGYSVPAFANSDQWGRASSDQKRDFAQDMAALAATVKDAVVSLDGGLELVKPDHDDDLTSKTFNSQARKSPELIPKFEGLLEGWCDAIQTYLDKPATSSSDDVGPLRELNNWRNRMQRLTSISEQLKRKDCKSVVNLLQAVTKNTGDPTKQKLVALLRRWKQTDVNITEAANEAKDNVKYLFTLERFIEPLYKGTTTTIVDTLPALTNSIKMIHTIARYYSTNERMTALFACITDQMIMNCKASIWGIECDEVCNQDSSRAEGLWEGNEQDLVRRLEACLKLSEAYQEQYRLTKKKLQSMPKGKQFDFNEMHVFGKFDLFCRRVIKLIDMFSTIDQFKSLSVNKLEGMEQLIARFHQIVKEFRGKGHDLLDYHNNKFDRDYVEFNVKISDLEGALQHFINQSFENITSIENSLGLLSTFQSILQRETLKSDLDSKLNVIFQNYGIELEQVQQLYEKQKHDPPIPRNLPPVAGNITWSRHLLKRIEGPMKQFELNQNVLDGPGARRIIKMYNKLARTLVAFEYLWHQAWVQSIDQAKSGLQATLIIRHPEDQKLYVNFDLELLQLVREAKCLDRMGVDIPESAKIVLFQEDKLKSYYNDLHWALNEYDRVVSMVIPVTAMVLRPHFNDMEAELRPGMVTLTWTSMNIDSYKAHVHHGLKRLEQLVGGINDVIEHRIEKNLKVVSRTRLVDLPDDQSFTVDEFVTNQHRHIEEEVDVLTGKNLEIEAAVDDLVQVIMAYQFEQPGSSVEADEIAKLRKHYNHFMYQALLHSAKNSLNALKKRIACRVASGFLYTARPFFEIGVRLGTEECVLRPSLDDIQGCINRSASAVLSCFKRVMDWKVVALDKYRTEEAPSFFERITKDIEIVRVALLLTGSLQGIRNTVAEYLHSFGQFDWLWQKDKAIAYKEFLEGEPSLEDYSAQLKSFQGTDEEIISIATCHNIGALSLNTTQLKGQFKADVELWQKTYCNNLHKEAREKLDDLSEYIRATSVKLEKVVADDDLDALGMMMALFKAIRERESGIGMEMRPIEEMYSMLEHNLPSGFMDKSEVDKRTVLESGWKKMVGMASVRSEELSNKQHVQKKHLKAGKSILRKEVDKLRDNWINAGPGVPGVDPEVALDRLRFAKDHLAQCERKYEVSHNGEELFALPFSEYPELAQTAKDIKLFDQLFSLYTDVKEKMNEWNLLQFSAIVEGMEDMTMQMDGFALRCKKMPGRLRAFDAYKSLNGKIEGFQIVLPLLQELAKPSIKVRHWDELKVLVKVEFDQESADFTLEYILSMNMETVADEVLEITDGADKQEKIEAEIKEITEMWEIREFAFKDWKGRPIPTLQATGVLTEELEESMMQMQTFLTMRHVAPFREEATELLASISDAADTLEQWVKVQLMWGGLESVFTGGDIAKQLPMEAKKFSKVDKDWTKIMQVSQTTMLVISCCQNEMLKAKLPEMYSELEKCSKALEGYLEQKRSKFPRFYFCSNSKLLQILSQGSDPTTMNNHYETVFDALERVDHDKKDKAIIRVIHGNGGPGHEEFPFVKPVPASGNIEDWLTTLLLYMQLTVKALCATAGEYVAATGVDIPGMRRFVDDSKAQVALLGIQFMWTADTQTALEECKRKKTGLKECDARQKNVLKEISSWCLQDLGTKVNRKKIETAVTIHVHQKDVTEEMFKLYKKKMIHDANDFEWTKQARFYWRPQANDAVYEKGCSASDGSVVIAITNFDFAYSYEYLGAKERLVVTPLTDRCYITLAQALGMSFGGAPAGPAGTGKTETTKDLGASLGIFVVVTNCGDQMSYKDCAKIFKGLCQSGIWGCFDEFNRIRLPVLSVVAQQVLAIQSAKKAGKDFFQFPGDPQDVRLNPTVGYFITMNPGYAGRQALPENLKALFRGMMMMVPNFQIIKAVKLCSVGYTQYEMLSKKFFVLYETCKLQLSNQKHYDWGLRNILSVLRTMGASKRNNMDKPESYLVYQTLRDMNLSKLVAQDVPLFLSILADLFPTMSAPSKAAYPDMETSLQEECEKDGKIFYEGPEGSEGTRGSWVGKVIQLYETTKVRHGIMLVGPTGGGKSTIFYLLRRVLNKIMDIQHRACRFNPKAIMAKQMYGAVDPVSQEWTTGVFAAMWAKACNRANPYNTWITADGPVDAIWIEDLNTVLDDNKILTLANGDRMPMTDNVKMMFEVETLKNASPATVSRAGIIYLSDVELDWEAMYMSWVAKRPEDQRAILTTLGAKWLGKCDPIDPGIAFSFLARNTKPMIATGRMAILQAMLTLIDGLTLEGGDPIQTAVNFEAVGSLDVAIEKIFIMAFTWSFGALLESDDRMKLNEWMQTIDKTHMPEGDVFEYKLDHDTCDWTAWTAPVWKYPEGDTLDFASILIPTVDAERTMYLIKQAHKQKKGALLIGNAGTAKTATVSMFLASLDMLTRTVNYSFATTMFGAQNAVEAELDKRGGKNFGPPNGNKMTFFIDDMSMPEVNNWGDQPTLELVRQLIEYSGVCFLDKDKRGDFKNVEDVYYIGGMGHPGGGRNDIPNRLKRQFYTINLTPPSINSINDIYGQMLAGRFPQRTTETDLKLVVNALTKATIKVWTFMQNKMLPTPAKFHYVFNMRDLSRVFQGMLAVPHDSVNTGGTRGKEGTYTVTPPSTLVNVWKHECERVFMDKLTNYTDKDKCAAGINETLAEVFDEAVVAGIPEQELLMVNFLREDIYDEDGVLQEEAPKTYEPGGTLKEIKERVDMFLDKYNEENPSRKMDLILFDDALKHLLKINRLMEMPRGSGLLVGVGGSGKQSLTRLSSYISRAMCFQITLTKTYNQASLLEDIRVLYRNAGAGKQTTFLFTESEIKAESFLETLNSVLMTGEVPGLFAKDEIMAMTAELRPSFLKNRPGVEETQDNLKAYLTDVTRDNLHLMLCMSPLNPKFPERARRFPGLVSAPTIDWFLTWPEEALVAVSRGFLGKFEMACDDDIKDRMMTTMGMCHAHTNVVCLEYFEKMRRQVYQTPKSYLSFIAAYQLMYKTKLAEIDIKESSIKLGLEKLTQGTKDVDAMKIVLAEEDKKLAVASDECARFLEGLQVSSAEAQREGDQVAKDKAVCEADAARISKEKELAMIDLAKAQPFVDKANKAIASIKPTDIQEIKANKNPTDIIKMIFDCILILFKKPLDKVKAETLYVKKEDLPFIGTSFKFSGQSMLGHADFLTDLQAFGAVGKDLMNEETVEFLFPYVDLGTEEGGEYFTPKNAKSASSAAEGLCIFAAAMKDYFYASRIVKPKLEALALAEASLNEAAAMLNEAETKLAAVQAKLAELQAMFERQMGEKKILEDNANMLTKKMTQATDLIGGLSGEQKRWTEDANGFASEKLRLVGDCAVACAFVSYCGPFNQEYRSYCIEDKYSNECEKRQVPVTQNLNIIEFLADIGTIGDWNQEGLPTDPLSIQNGILVTRSSRFPLLIDPQGQAVGWITCREKERLPAASPTVQLSDPKLKDKLEFAMQEGKAFVVLGVENEIDPMLDPVLEKQYVQKGRRYIITISDKQMDYDMNFMAYFITRLPNPSFSPELQAKTTVVDFTVTQKGLEEQLLGKVIGKEQRALEEQLELVLQEVNSNTKALLALDASLLDRLTSNTGNLLDDEELVDVLGFTKAKAEEVSQKLIAADETKISINEKREQFRPVATRGSCLYFSIVEVSAVNPMYQTSLAQFLGLFMSSMDKAERASLASKRVENIIEAMTYITYRYINRGLYEKDKLTFILICTMKILVTAGLLKGSDVTLFLQGGAALDISTSKRKPFGWMTNDAWLCILALSNTLKFFGNMPADMAANESTWRRWYEDNEPEQLAIPDYESRIAENTEIGPFLRLLVVRMLRSDRCIIQARDFIKSTAQMGPRFTEAVTDTMDATFEEMIASVPTIFLLSAGVDPTEGVELLARKRKLPPPAVISLGEGQEPVAIKAVMGATQEGLWVLLQNCELALELMADMELMLQKVENMDPGFRLFITCLPHKDFPLGLLQMCTKVTNEPPMGLRAGLLRTYTVTVDQERLERVETEQWRKLLFALSFLHSVVQERRKFGAIGWCIAYEYNTADLTACILFLEGHLYSGPISWPTLQFMVAEVQYGGKITDSVDRRMFITYAEEYLKPIVCEEGYSYTPKEPVMPIPGNFDYNVPGHAELAPFKAYIESFPESDSPEISGLHPNANLTYQINGVNALINTLKMTQPKGGGGGGGESLEDGVTRKCKEFISRLPEEYNVDDYTFKIQKLGGLTIPLNIFLFQEIQRMQDVLSKVGFQLAQLILAIKGEVVLTDELAQCLDAIGGAATPWGWIYTPSKGEFSWILPSLGQWFSSLIARDEQDRSWLNKGRPPCFWITGWFNPTGFLTAIKQEVTRKHKQEKWALDEVLYRTEVTTMATADQCRSTPPEGVYVNGLFLDGAALDIKQGLLVESEPKKLITMLPVLFVSGLIRDEALKRQTELYGKHGPYACPVYKYPVRGDGYPGNPDIKDFIFYVTLKCTVDKPKNHWTLRGAALLTNETA